MSSATVSPRRFARLLLADIGVKDPTKGDLRFVESWETAEGGNWINSARYNPLNTSLRQPGSVNYSTGSAGSGVQSYTSWTQGLKATAATILAAPYSGVVAALRHHDQAAAEQALAASPWDATHYAHGLPSSSAAAAYAKAHKNDPNSQGSAKLAPNQAGVNAKDLGGGSSLLGKIAHDANPVNLVKDAGESLAADAAKGVVAAFDVVLGGPVKTGLLYAGFAGVGLVLVVGGLLSLTKGARQKVTSDAGNVIPAASGSPGGGKAAAGESAAEIPPEAALAL